MVTEQGQWTKNVVKEQIIPTLALVPTITLLAIMKTLLIISSLMLLASSVVGQVGKNYIETSGRSSQTFPSNGVRVTLAIQEIEHNERYKIIPRSFEEVKQDVVAQLDFLGYKEKDLEEVWPPTNSRDNLEQKSYFIYLKNMDEAKSMSKFDINGYSIKSFEYTYPEDINSTIDYNYLSVEALKDSKLRANQIGESIGQKIGKVTRIQDKNYRLYDVLKRIQSKPEFVLDFTITVRYELLD